ncbi:MAG: hypothetical protein OET44_13955 [Gammaproteobacteria bacterium]|nr:hypothetical protein [Gammaproteobacteria bacterium]
MKIRLGGLSAVIFAVGLSTQAYASSTDVVLNLEGNPTCSSLGDNAAIIEIRESDFMLGAENPNTATGDLLEEDGSITLGGLEIEYTINDAGTEVTHWEITKPTIDPDTDLLDLDKVNPINYTILKARGNDGARVFHFGKKGAIEDDEETARNDGDLTAISFCYGLTVGAEIPSTPPLPSDSIFNLGDCSELASDTLLDSTGISCPNGTSSDQQRVLISLDVTPTTTAENKPDFNFRFCTCNVPEDPDTGETLPQCDPNLTRDMNNTTDQICTNSNVENGTNKRVPLVIEGVQSPNSYICFTSGGTRYCYGHF